MKKGPRGRMAGFPGCCSVSASPHTRGGSIVTGGFFVHSTTQRVAAWAGLRILAKRSMILGRFW